MTLSKPYKLRNFIFLSLVVHLILGKSSGFLLLDNIKPKIPIRVKFIEPQKEKKEDLNLKKGKILEIPRPEKIEKPITQSILSDYNSRARRNKSSTVKKKYKSSKTVLPKSKPKSKPKPIIKKKIVHNKIIPKEKVPVKRKKPNKKNIKKTIIAKKEVLNKEIDKTKKAPLVLKGLFTNQNNTKETKEKKKPSIFKGFDLEKFAKYDTRDNEDDSDTETVFLDSQEFKYASYFAIIKKQIEKVWSYPEQAAINGLRGELLMQFVLDRSGKLIKISLINSSGYKILDDAALNAVKIASPFDSYPRTIQKKKLRIIASFTYKPFYTQYQ